MIYIPIRLGDEVKKVIEAGVISYCARPKSSFSYRKV
jgi:hypothetical protein